MPHYLALDYAAEAIREHRSFLGSFLLTLPSSLDNYEAYAHTGSLEDYGYRLPWLQVKRINTLQSLFLEEDLAGSIKRLSSPRERDDLEFISFQDDLKQDKVHVLPIESLEPGCETEDELEIIPSSNPDSPPVDSQTRRRIKSSLSIHRAVSGEKLSDGKDTMKGNIQENDITKLLLEDTVSCSDHSCLIPTCEELCRQLPRKSIKDPFAELPAEKGLELLAPKKESQDVENKEGILFSLEAWQESNQKSEVEHLLLPAMMSSSNIKGNPSITDHFSMLNESSKTLETGEEESSFDWTSRDFLDSSLRKQSERTLFPEHHPHVTLVGPDATELNNQGPVALEKESKQSSLRDAILEVPGTPMRLPEEADDLREQKTKLPMTPISCFDASIVTPRARKRTEDQVWRKEQYLHEAVVLSLKVPELKTVTSPSNTHVPLLELSKDEETSHVDTVLPWKPVTIAKEGRIKYSGSVEKMDLGAEEKTVSEMNPKAEIEEEIKKFDEDSLDDIADELLDPFHTEEKDEANQQKSEERVAVQETDTPTQDAQEGSATTEINQNLKLRVEGRKVEKETSDSNVSLSLEPSLSVNPKSRGAKSNGWDPLMAMAMRDPLEDFLKLRRKDSLLENRNNPPLLLPPPLPPPHLPAVKPCSRVQQTIANAKDHCADAVTEVAVKKDEISQEQTSSYEPPAVKAESKKTKSRLVVVTLSAPFLDMIKVLEEAATPVVTYLHGNHALSPSYTFSSLTMDITRFLLMQHEKQSKSEKDPTEIYKNIILLHTYVTAADLMTHCDAITAIMHLAAVSEKYKDVLAGSMTSVRNALFKRHCLLPRGTLHPKLGEMARLAGEWFQKKLKKEGREHDPKVLVILKRDAGKLAENIASVLSSVKGLSACSLVAATLTTYTTIIESLDSHNCVVITSSQIIEAFPWAQFSLVIEYEASAKSPWKELCLRQKIRHIELGTVSHMTSASKMDAGNAIDTDSKDDTPGDHDKVTSPPLKLIGFEKVISSSKLLQILETKYNILIVERGVASLSSQSFLPIRLPTVDLLIDERTGIIIHDLEALLEEGSVDPLVHRITLLSQQLCMLWLILQGSSQENRYSLGGHVVTNTAKLHAALAQFSTKEDDFEVKVMYSGSNQSTAATIELICGKAKEAATNVWHADDWTARPWLTDRLSRHEKFLSNFPCLNAFSAQVILTAAPLPVLLSASFKQLLQLCPWIPTRILLDFYNLAHDTKLNSAPVNISQEVTDRIKAEPCVKTEGNRQASEVLPSDKDRSIGYDGFDTRECNTTATGIRNNHRESVEGRDWSIMRSSSEGFPQATSLPSNQNAPALRIKSEPVSPEEVNRPCQQMQKQSIPDDLKTPLELLASCDKSNSADDRHKVNVGVNCSASDDSCSQFAHPQVIRKVLDETGPVIVGINHKALDGSHSHFANPSHLKKPFDDRQEYLVSHNKSYASSSSWHEQLLTSHKDFHDRKAAPSDTSSYGILSTSLDSNESLIAESGYPHRQHPTAATRSLDRKRQEWEDTSQSADLGMDRRIHSQAADAQHMVHSSRMPSRDMREKVRTVNSMFGQQDRDPSWKRYVGIAQPCPRSSAAPDSPKTISRAGPTYAGQMQNTLETGAEELEYRRQQYLQQQQQQKYLQQQEVPHNQHDYPLYQQIWQQQKVEVGARRESAGMVRYRELQPHPDEWYLNQRVPSTSAVVRENFEEELHNRSGYDTYDDFFSDAPSKKRRLACERIPGAKDGQTRLTFR